jgi:hypothetical protein
MPLKLIVPSQAGAARARAQASADAKARAARDRSTIRLVTKHRSVVPTSPIPLKGFGNYVPG